MAGHAGWVEGMPRKGEIVVCLSAVGPADVMLSWLASAKDLHNITEHLTRSEHCQVPVSQALHASVLGLQVSSGSCLKLRNTSSIGCAHAELLGPTLPQ